MGRSPVLKVSIYEIPSTPLRRKVLKGENPFSFLFVTTYTDFEFITLRVYHTSTRKEGARLK